MTPSFRYGITIISAHSPAGYQYGEFEISTNASGGFERYKWQSGGGAKMWRVDSHDSKTLVASGDDVSVAMAELLKRVHTTPPHLLTYREFQIFVDGWVEGNGQNQS